MNEESVINHKSDVLNVALAPITFFKSTLFKALFKNV